MRVLIVEDSRLLAEHLLEQLTTLPAVVPVGVVDTEQKAVAAIAEQNAELVILDLHLKQGTGFGVLAALRKLPKAPIAIVFTNYALPQYREQATSMGAKYFLDKSNDFEVLPQLIGKIIGATEAQAKQATNN